VELGSGPSGFPNEARLDQYRIRGCTSRVWLLIEPASSEETATARWWFDSDSVVIRGVLRVVAAAYADLSVAQLRDGELERRLAEGGIGRYLLPSRARGLHEVLRRLRGVVEDRA
jgi:cysteine desulfuration protein SufE